MEASVVIEDTDKAGTETDFAVQAGARWTGTEFDGVRRFAASKAVTGNIGMSDKDVGKSALIFTAIIGVCVASGLSLGLFFPEKQNDGSALCAHIA